MKKDKQNPQNIKNLDSETLRQKLKQESLLIRKDSIKFLNEIDLL